MRLRRPKPTARWPLSRQRGARHKLTPTATNPYAALADLSGLIPDQPAETTGAFAEALSSAEAWEKDLTPCSEEEIISYLFGPEAVHSSLAQTIERRRHDSRVTVVAGPKTKQ